MDTEKKQRRQMSPEELNQIKQDMLERKKFLWNQILQDLESEASEKHQEIIANMREDNERGLEDLRESNAIKFVEMKVGELEQIEDALNRIEAGEYGRCKDCGNWIRPARLQIVPNATRCIKCQEQMERIKNI